MAKAAAPSVRRTSPEVFDGSAGARLHRRSLCFPTPALPIGTRARNPTSPVELAHRHAAWFSGSALLVCPGDPSVPPSGSASSPSRCATSTGWKRSSRGAVGLRCSLARKTGCGSLVCGVRGLAAWRPGQSGSATKEAATCTSRSRLGAPLRVHRAPAVGLPTGSVGTRERSSLVETSTTAPVGRRSSPAGPGNSHPNGRAREASASRATPSLPWVRRWRARARRP